MHLNGAHAHHVDVLAIYAHQTAIELWQVTGEGDLLIHLGLQQGVVGMLQVFVVLQGEVTALLQGEWLLGNCGY